MPGTSSCKNLQALGIEHHGDLGDAGHVATRPIEARDQPECHRVAAHGEGMTGCCARAASGHAAIEPAITLMKSRRSSFALIRSPRRRGRAALASPFY
jgi:hypothetical protein